MPVVRVEKTNNYTVMSNVHLHDRSMSLKTKGLLSMMLSLPDSWDYTVDGLANLCCEGIGYIRQALRELEDKGYLVKERHQDDRGRFSYEWIVYEEPHITPCTVIPHTVEPHTVTPHTVNCTQSNTNILNTNIQNTKELNTNIYIPPINPPTGEPEKKKRSRGELISYGEFGHVKLSKAEVDRLEMDFGADIAHASINYLDAYIEEKGGKQSGKNHNLTIRRWVIGAVNEQRKRNPSASYRYDWIDAIEL